MRRLTALLIATFVLPVAVAHADPVPKSLGWTPPPVDFQVAPVHRAVSPDVWRVDHPTELVLWAGSEYWTRHDGRWFRMKGYNGFWESVSPTRVPREVRLQFELESLLAVLEARQDRSVARLFEAVHGAHQDRLVAAAQFLNSRGRLDLKEVTPGPGTWLAPVVDADSRTAVAPERPLVER